MKPEFVNMDVRTRCPDCDGAVTTFEFTSRQHGEFGSVTLDCPHNFHGSNLNRIVYMLLRCAGFGRGGLAEIHCDNNVGAGDLGAFYPRSIDSVPVPDNVPDGIVKEFREAELCASVEAWRAASAMLRSALEKTLGANGYTKGTLANKIDEAAADGVITAARCKRAHDDIRVLGNDVLHDPWREITEDEVAMAHKYAQRILEDLYDDRPSVEAILASKGRISAEPENNS